MNPQDYYYITGQQVTIGLLPLFKMVLVVSAVWMLLVMLLIKSLFHVHFKQYQKWFETQVYNDWRASMHKLRESFDVILDRLQDRYDGALEEDENKLEIVADHLYLIGERLRIHEALFDKVMSGIMLVDTVTTKTKEAKEKIRSKLDEWERLGDRRKDQRRRTTTNTD